MAQYRRAHVPGAMWFFTVSLAERQGNHLLVQHIDELRQAFWYVREKHPSRTDAVVVLPDHLHCIRTLPAGDAEFSIRWKLLKGQFSRVIENGERISQSREKRRERGLWQRRFWNTCYEIRRISTNMSHIHWNPVKHGGVKQVAGWLYSSPQDYVARGVYSANWGYDGGFDVCAGE